MTTERDQLLGDHRYDGIQEYDNPTPGWWHLLFFSTILFSIGYFVVYEMGDALPTIQDVAQADENAANEKIFGGLGDLQPDEPTILTLMSEPRWIAVGQSIFKANCSSCHGPDGQGNDIGVNLTDDVYKNIKALPDFARVIREGANNLAMPAWKGRLSDKQIVLMAAYAASLRGKNLPGRKPEGEVIPPWPTRSAAPAAAPAPKAASLAAPQAAPHA